MLRYDGMVFNRGAFLAALGSDWSVDIKRVRSMGTCFCGGQGCLAARWMPQLRFRWFRSRVLFVRKTAVSAQPHSRRHDGRVLGLIRSDSSWQIGNSGLFMNTLHGSGMVFLQAGGTVMRRGWIQTRARVPTNLKWNMWKFAGIIRDLTIKTMSNTVLNKATCHISLGACSASRTVWTGQNLQKPRGDGETGASPCRLGI